MEMNDNMRSQIITWLSVAEPAYRFKTKRNTLIVGTTSFVFQLSLKYRFITGISHAKTNVLRGEELRLIFATQFIVTFQPNIILIFSIDIQPIYPISKQEVSMNLDCNFQAIDSRHGRCAGLTETAMCEARTGSREMRLIIDVCTKQTKPCSTFTL